MQNGANAVQTAPGAAAAAHQQLMLAKVTEAINSGKWAARVGAVPLSEWKSAYINKGIPRVASGAQAAAPKMQAFLQEFLPVAAAVSAQIDAMPKNTIEDSVARSAAAIRAFNQWGKGRK
jgi:hypothetical protein